MPKGGKRQGAGRPKNESENITFSVRGHKNVVDKTRQFAKEQTDIEISKTESGTKNTE